LVYADIYVPTSLPPLLFFLSRIKFALISHHHNITPSQSHTILTTHCFDHIPLQAHSTPLQAYTNPLIWLSAVSFAIPVTYWKLTLLIRPGSHIDHHTFPLDPHGTMTTTTGSLLFERTPYIDELDQQRVWADYNVSECEKSLAGGKLKVS